MIDCFTVEFSEVRLHYAVMHSLSNRPGKSLSFWEERGYLKQGQVETVAIYKLFVSIMLSVFTYNTAMSHNIKHLLDETESNIQFIASGQGNIERSEAEPNIILYGRNQLDVGQGQVQ